MFSISLLITIIILLSMMVVLAATLLSKKTLLDREKTSPFECGFDPFSNSRIPFSLRFFMIAIIFLVFDVEIAILLPLPLMAHNMSYITWLLVSSIFMVTLIIGLMHEWNFGSLEWSE